VIENSWDCGALTPLPPEGLGPHDQGRDQNAPIIRPIAM